MDIVWDHCPICESRSIVICDDIGRCNECNHGFRVHVPGKIKPHYYDRQYWRDDKNRQGIMTLAEEDGWERWIRSRLKILKSFGLIDDEPLKKKKNSPAHFGIWLLRRHAIAQALSDGLRGHGGGRL